MKTTSNAQQSSEQSRGAGVVSLWSGAGEGGLRSSRGSPRVEPTPALVIDPEMVRIHAMLERVAPSSLTVLILGETGAGKEIASEAIHRHSMRAGAPFVKVNSAGLPESLVESELFGYEKGAFSGATESRPGIFEAAHGGTLFLDEVGELSPHVQAKLLRVLESGEVRRVGSAHPRRVDVRVVSATHRDLKQMALRGEFRQDLFFRLSGVTVSMPALRERTAEIVPLAKLFVARACGSMRRPPLSLCPQAAAALERYPWPGNIRELKHTIERAVVMCTGDVVELADLGLDADAAPPAMASATSNAETEADPGIRGELRAFERERIVGALDRAGGNQTRAAALLGVSRRTLINKLIAYGIDRPRKRTAAAGESIVAPRPTGNVLKVAPGASSLLRFSAPPAYAGSK